MVDMSDIASLYSDVYASAANRTADSLKNKLESADASNPTDDELMDACKQFEAYFVEQLYKGMLKTIPKSEETSNYTSMMADFYQDQMVQSMAEMTTEQTSLGLAKMLYEQLRRNYGTADIPKAEEKDDLSGETAPQDAAADGAETV